MKRILLVVSVCAALLVVGCVLYAGRMVHRGFSTRTAPSSFESSFAMSMRNTAIPSRYKRLRNPVSVTPEVIHDGIAHWAGHCATCHADNGSRDTMFQC